MYGGGGGSSGGGEGLQGTTHLGRYRIRSAITKPTLKKRFEDGTYATSIQTNPSRAAIVTRDEPVAAPAAPEAERAFSTRATNATTTPA